MKKPSKIILGIETSCDDTSIALIEENNQASTDNLPNVHFLKSFSQEELFVKWGGVVPEIAARNHMEKMIPIFQSLLESPNIKDLITRKLNSTLKNELEILNLFSIIDGIAVTTTPGLLGPLLTGINFAKTLGLLFEKPMIPTHHLRAHLEAIFLSENVSYPYLGMLLSGGHSQFYVVYDHKNFELIGSTIDDACGEAFDKGGKLLGLAYPGGKLIDLCAQLGDKNRYTFPIGLKDSKNSMMSFSGLKSSLRVFLEQNPHFPLKPIDIHLNQYHQDFYDLCASYQEAIIQQLKLKLYYAEQIMAQKIPQLPLGHKNFSIVVGGGVACNSRLRQCLNEAYSSRVKFVLPKYCTDNGGMVANYGLRNFDQSIPFPQSLTIDPKNFGKEHS